MEADTHAHANELHGANGEAKSSNDSEHPDEVHGVAVEFEAHRFREKHRSYKGTFCCVET